jgi:diaminohydroxyphosphoribosylaminopyrimidine deaminase/5-amino-6-(5-phosphoribosylamino)uracil reductase
VLADDPILSVRHGPERKPCAVVLDSQARLPRWSRLVRERAGELIVVVSSNAAKDRVDARSRTIARVIRTTEVHGAIDLRDALGGFGLMGIRSLYVEGGRRLIGSFLAAELYDRISSYVAPVLLGGPHRALEPRAVPTIGAAVRLERGRSEVIGTQAMVTGHRPGWRSSVCHAMQEASYVHGSR